MTYDRAIEGTSRGSQRVRGRKSWPHVLSPMGRGKRAGPMMSKKRGAVPSPLAEKVPRRGGWGAFERSL